jgi:hypothetical protein
LPAVDSASSERSTFNDVDTAVRVDTGKPPKASWSAEVPVANAARVASRFDVTSPVEAYDFAEKGNINRHTFLVLAGSADKREYLLQQINQQVFVRPSNVMAAMTAIIDAQKTNLTKLSPSVCEGWEAITLVPLRDGAPYLELLDRRGVSYWRLMEKIPDAITFKSLNEIDGHEERLRIAGETGRGLALFGDLTSTVDVSVLANPLPGYRDTKLYFNQLASVLEGNRNFDDAAKYLPTDDALFQSTGRHFLVHAKEDVARKRMEDPELQPVIELARDQRDFALRLVTELEAGTIRKVAIHGDTKLDNFLFSAKTGRVKALVDLDTIMPHTWLADWGDMARSLTNVAGEKETDLSRVQVNMEIYSALATGFLKAASEVTEHEVDLMVDAVQTLTLELGVRFLADYLRGDSYFQLGPADPPDLNKTRAMVQFTLFQRLRDLDEECRKVIANARSAGARDS